MHTILTARYRTTVRQRRYINRVNEETARKWLMSIGFKYGVMVVCDSTGKVIERREIFEKSEVA